MKNFVRIFAIYFLVLTFLPCGGMFPSCCDENSSEKTENSAANDQESDKGCCGDDCTFCLCASGGNVLIQPNVVELEFFEETPLAQNQPIFYHQMPRLLFSSGIWQPPQFG